MRLLSFLNQTNTSNHSNLLSSCQYLDSLLQIHGNLLVTGAESNNTTRTHLINSYSSFGKTDSALSIFNSTPSPDVFIWNSMIRCYARSNQHSKAVHFYHGMLERGVEPDKYTFTFALKACTGALDSGTGVLVHKEVVRRGLQGDVFIETGLVDMYCKLGMVDTARELFESVPESDAVLWNAMIDGLSQSGSSHEALALFKKMVSRRIVPDSVTFLNLFPAICDLSELILCRALHGSVIRRCLLPIVYNGLIDTYSKCRRTDIARRIFDGMSGCRNDVTWGTMISGYTYDGHFTEALELFDDLRKENMKLNQVSVVSALMAAAETRDLKRGVDIHGYAVQKGLDFHVSVSTMLITMYAKCGDLEEAKLLFEGFKERDVVAWSAMISAYAQTGCSHHAISLFQEMQLTGISPNQVTIVSLLPACADFSDLNLGKSVHCYALKSKIDTDVYVGTALVAMYAQCGYFKLAHAIFDGLQERQVVTWNALINGYSQCGDAANALQMFKQLQSTGQHPDAGTMVGVLSAYALLNAVEEGSSAHALSIKHGFETDLHVKNATIDMYAKCGDLPGAKFLFSKTKSENDIVSWNTIIGGYMHNGHANDALNAFHIMKREDLKPNKVTLVSVIPAAAYLAALRVGLALHSYVIRTGFESHLLVANSLIDMYAKCGCLHLGRYFFDQMGYRDTVSWNVMLAGYAIHGLGEGAVQLFSEMKGNRVEANSVSFLSALSACRHGGLLAEGRSIFNSMQYEYHLEPNLEHYACVVDLLGRAGGFDEALNLIQGMPMAPDVAVWGALLGASRMHSDIRMGEIALGNLVQLEPQNPAHYVALSNIYSQVGRWADAGKIRAAMRQTGSNKLPGCSWVEIHNTIHAFTVGDQSHPQYERMRRLWNDVYDRMVKVGYVPETSSVLYNVEEEEKQSFLSGHSERLAMSFALLNSEPGAEIRIVKNLRVCGDCHSVTKLLSKITNRRIVVRDSSRFHHFEDGVCSCKDYW